MRSKVKQAILIAAACLALATPAFAQTQSTLQVLTSRGIVMQAGGMEIDVTYRPDGTFTAMDDQVTGKWRIAGDKLCTMSNFAPAEECVAYPAGKKSGDSFEVTSSQGTATVRIK